MTDPLPIPRSHPDRCAATLADVDAACRHKGDGPFAAPGAGARDSRIDLKLLAWRALSATLRSAAARARLRDLDRARRPDLWAGTVQDGTARGFAVALEEAISLAAGDAPRAATAIPGAAKAAAEPATDPVATQTFTGKELRKKKDLLVGSGGARVRFSRKEGLLFVDRYAGVNSPNCLRFEARRDRGDLDGFAGDETERPRLFSAQFLQPVRYAVSPGRTELELAGRLGRGARGFACLVSLLGVETEPTVRLTMAIDNRHQDHRLRARFLGVPAKLIAHECTDVREVVQNDSGGFVAFTLVRAVGVLAVDGAPVAVPAAQCQGPVRHVFLLGSA
jgi:hypothetical protein